VTKISRILAGVAALAAAWSIAPAMASDYPNRPITVIVPYTAGGPSDIAIRSISDRLSQALGQTIVIENASGAGGMTGAARAARSAPDGYTLLLHQNGLVISPAINPNQPIDVAKDLTGIGMVNGSFLFLVGSTGIPAKNVPDLIKWMKGPGKPAKIAHPGLGSLAHLQAILFAKAVGADATFVGYRGGGQAMNDIVGGHADLVFAAPPTAAPLIEAGKVQGFGYAAPNRYPALSSVPTLSEGGVPAIDLRLWQGLFAPAGTPRPIIDRINAALRETLADGKVKATYAQNGVEAFPADQMTPEAVNELVRSELKKWRDLVVEAKISIDANN
jgi:tripartite-type tricarboxylate transporter receptor subunit TctC